MAHNTHFPSLREIRQLLNTVFDDVELDAFCLDYFDHIYDKFSSDMRKDKKLNLLLDYCRRSDARFHLFLRAIHECDQAEFHAFFQLKGIVIADLQGKTGFSAGFSYQAALAYHFDLIEQLNDCLNALWRKKGVVGFVVGCSSPVFLKNLCERVKYELGRDRVRLMPPLMINPIRSDIEQTIRTMRRRYKAALRDVDVLFTVQVPDEKMANRFWQSLLHVALSDELINRLIVIVAISPHCALPEGFVPLQAPHFGAADVVRWVRSVVNELAWPEQMFDSWTEQMMTECSHEDQLQLEWVYDHLDAMLNLLKQNPSIERFQEELEKRRQIYV